MNQYLCTYDVGTTGVKAALVTPEGRLSDTAYIEYGIEYPGPRMVEQSVEKMWRAQCSATRGLLDDSGVKPERIAAVAVSCQRATFVPVDKDYKPMGPFIGWQDRRGIEQCERLKKELGLQRYYSIAGLTLDPTAAISKIIWLRENRPEVYANAHQFASTHNIHLHQLGVIDPPCDLSNAAYLGLLDVDNLTWSRELLDELDIPADKMPPLTPSGVTVGEVSAAAAKATGLAAGTSIVAAGGDLQVAGLGMGVVRAGVVSVGIGTGGGILVGLDKPIRHPDFGLNCLPHAVQGMWEMEGNAIASGGAYKWFRDALGRSEQICSADMGCSAYDVLNAKAACSPPGANGLLFMPSLLGSSSPNFYPHAKGLFIGLTTTTSKNDMVRAVLEGVCLELRWIIQAAERLGTPIDEVRIWGGAAKSKLWNQIAADVYGVPAITTETPEAGLLGAAVCAAQGVGIHKNAQEAVEAMVRVAERYQPNPEPHDLYNQKYAIYQDFFFTLKKSGIFERLEGV